MNIIPIFYDFTNIFNEKMSTNINPLNLEQKIIETGDDFTLKLYEDYLSFLDRCFKYSSDRLEKYIVKETTLKTLTSSIGNITFTSTRYIDRKTKKSYYPIRDILNLKAYQRMTNEAEHTITKYAMENNMSQAAKHALRNTPISRSTVSKKVAKLNGSIKEDIKKSTNQPDVLYIEIDEILDDVPDFPSVPVVWDVNKLTHNQAIELLFTDNKNSIQRGIDAGADVYKIYPKYFESPLRYHVRQGRAWAVELLIKDNFSVDKCSHEIYLAIANSDLKVLTAFFKNGLSANDIDVSKDKPFFEYAMQYEDPDILNLFLAHGVFINKPIYSGGCTAFQYAIANELPYTARRLYKYAGSDLLDEVINDRFNKRVSLSFVLGVLDDAEINYTNHIA